MSTPANHWKLGLFVVLGLALTLTALVVFGAASMRRESVSYTFYFDESVQGLDVGSPTKFRGVTIGNVASIDVAPDQRHVQVTGAMDVTELKRLGLAVTKGLKVHVLTPPELRVQLASQGVTGVKFLLIDFFPVKDYPAPQLPFAVPENYIPTATSTLKNLEDAVTRATDRLPEILDAVLGVVKKADVVLDNFDTKQLTAQGLATLQSTDRTLGALRTDLERLDTGGLSKRANSALDNLNNTITQLNVVVARLSDDKGLLASAQKTTNALGDVARNTSGVTSQLADTLQSIREAADSVQRIADDLDNDPDMLLKGRKRAKK